MRDNARRRRGAVKFDFHIARCINFTFLEHSSASAHERQSCSGLGGARASLAHAARHSTSMNLWFLTHSPSRAHCSHFSGVAAPRAPRAPSCPAAMKTQSRRILPRSARVGASRLVGKAAVSHSVTRAGEQRWRSHSTMQRTRAIPMAGCLVRRSQGSFGLTKQKLEPELAQ